MQSFAFLSAFVLALLYGPATAAATEDGQAIPAGAQPPASGNIALVLPLQSPAFARSAESVRQGFLAAAKVHGKRLPRIMLYATRGEDADVVAAYERAVGEGAGVVVGPLTRTAINALILGDLVTVPTLALNQPDPTLELPAKLYVLALQAESEARQVASFARSEGYSNALVVTSESPLAKRIQRAFTEEWEQRGGRAVAIVSLQGDKGAFAKVRDVVSRSKADMVFLAVDAARARAVRPFIDKRTPVYATSQVYARKDDTLGNGDLEGVRFLDMPWLVQPDHAAVMVYPRPDNPDASNDQERLYALGIDAFRVTQQILAAPASPGGTLDGVTGRLSFGYGGVIQRELTPAEFRDAQPAVLYGGR